MSDLQLPVFEAAVPILPVNDLAASIDYYEDCRILDPDANELSFGETTVR